MSGYNNQLTHFDTALIAESTHQGRNSSSWELDDVIDAPLAIITDLATSTYNSFVTENHEVSTAEALNKIGANDALDFYENNRTFVEVSSFIGGLVVPGLLAAKAMRYARAGATSMTGGNRFQKFAGRYAKGKAAHSAHSLQLVEAGQIATTEYAQARRAWTLNAIGDAAMEGAAFEVAFVGMFNGHPFMDDYDPSDFVLGTVFGAAFVPFRYVIDARKYKLAAAEVEQRAAVASRIGIYPSQVGIPGTQGDQFSAMAENITNREQVLKGEESLTGAALELATRDQLNANARMVDVATGMMDADVKAHSKAVQGGRKPAGEEGNFWAMSTLDRVIEVAKRTSLSFSGVRKFKFFDSATAPSREVAQASDINYALVDDADSLRGSTSVALEEFEGGTIDSVFHTLTAGRRRLTADAVSNDALKAAGWDDWQDVFNVAEHEFDGVIVKLKRSATGIDVESVDGDAIWAVGSEFNDFMQDLLIHARADGVNIPVNMRVNWTDPVKFPKKGTLKSMHDKATGRSVEVSSFLTDEFRRGSFTPEMIAGTRAIGARQVFAHLVGPSGTRQVTTFTGVRDMIDLPGSGAADFAVVELKEGARIATFQDINQLSKEFADLHDGLDLTAAASATTKEAQDFLSGKGFSAMDVNLSNAEKRVFKNSGMVVFKGEGTIKRRLPSDHTEAVRQYRLDNNLPDLTDEFAVLDPYSGKVVAASQAMLIQRAADLADGYRFNRKYSMQGALEQLRDFNPLEHATSAADSQYLDALHALNRDNPKFLRIAENDLPRMQAAVIGDLGSRVEVVRASGGVESMTQKSLIDRMQESKIETARLLTAKGYGMEQVSVYTNLPLETVEAIVAGGFNKAEVLRGDLKNITSWMQYNSAKQASLKSFLNPKQVLLEGEQAAMSNLLKERQWSKIDSQLAKDLAQSTIGEISAQGSSQVPLIGVMYDKLINTPNMKALNKHVDAFFAKSTLGAVAVNSRDFVLRKLNELGTTDGADLGNMVVQIGEDFAREVNAYNKEMLEQVNGSFTKIRMDPVTTVQFNDVYRSLQKLERGDQRNVVFDPDSGQFVLGRDEKTGEITGSLGYIREGNFTDQKIVITNPELADFYQNVWPKVQNQLWHLQNTNRKMIGAAAPGRVGVWFPYNNLSEANIAYVIDPNDIKKTRMISAKNTGDLESQIARVREELEPGHQIIRRGDTKDWNDVTGYAQLNDIERADAGLKRSGILVEGTPADDRIMQDILDGIQGDVWKHSRQYMRLASGDLFTQLDRFTKHHKVPQISNAQNFNQKSAKKLSTSEVVAKTILNQDLLADSHLLNTVNNSYSYMIDKATDTVNAVWDTVRRENVLGKGGTSKIEWEKISQGLEDAGVPNPWKGWENFVADNPAWRKTDAKEKVARMNSILATFNLRLLETAHAAITTMTIPVVLAGELTKKDFPLRYMMNGARRLADQSKYWKDVKRIGKEKGYSRGRASEALTKTLADGFTDPGLWSKVEDTKLMGWLTSPSDAAENLSRQLSYLTGYEVAISKYGKDVPAELLETYANQFTNRTMGNYTARQRPTMFQGSLGATFGLYQTFMLTMFQNMFRFLEGQNYSAMRNLMLAQTGVFGISSLPFFDPISRAIGSYTNGDEADITTTTYEMFGNNEDESRSLAEYTLFGLPSTLMQSAFYTRGELQPRTPINPEGTPFTEGAVTFAPPIINTLKQLHDTAWDVGTRVATQLQTDGTPIDIGRAVAEGISIQSMWRPGARLAELITGNSFDRAGKVISSQAEAQMNWATFARVMAVRPLKEQVARNLNFLGKYYDAKDQAKRREAVIGMRSMVANGDTSRIGGVFDKYLNQGGSANGWNSAVNEAYLAVGTPYAARVRKSFQNRPEIAGALEGYSIF